MTADTIPQPPPESTPDNVVTPHNSNPQPDQTGSIVVAAYDADETDMLQREGLPSNAMILAPSMTITPMRQPEDAWAMLVLAVNIIDDTDPDREGEIALFAGSWLFEQSPADLCEGDVVLVLTEPDDESFQADRVDVEMLFAHRNRWQRVGEWAALDARWPWTVALTTAAIMSLHTDAAEAATPAGMEPPFPSPLRGWIRAGGIVDLVDAGLVQPGEEFHWERPGLGIRHTARIQSDGTLRLADGRIYANPSGATTVLGGNHQNGWKAWKRTSDGRVLGDLRAQLRERCGLPADPIKR